MLNNKHGVGATSLVSDFFSKKILLLKVVHTCFPSSNIWDLMQTNSLLAASNVVCQPETGEGEVMNWMADQFIHTQ